MQTAVLTAWANEFQQSDSDALSLLAGAFPSTATTMLAEWESTLGLPDACAIGETDSIALRQNAVTTKLTTVGGQSIDYFVAQAAALGYSIAITQYRPARAGLSACGAAINGDDWPFVMLVTAPDTTITTAQAGVNYAGDPLRSWGNKILECRINSIAPSHVIVKYAYIDFGFDDQTVYELTSEFCKYLDTSMSLLK
ncbi:DUF2313 domain-containing protein (plasmid) [Rouxiella badensis]|nr:DUF2313 domain-containing protein [Rouxiella badensis]